MKPILTPVPDDTPQQTSLTGTQTITQTVTQTQQNGQNGPPGGSGSGPPSGGAPPSGGGGGLPSGNSGNSAGGSGPPGGPPGGGGGGNGNDRGNGDIPRSKKGQNEKKPDGDGSDSEKRQLDQEKDLNANRQRRSGRGRPPGDPDDNGDDEDSEFSDSNDPFNAYRRQRLLRQGREREGRGLALKLPDKFHFPKLPQTAAQVKRWFTLVDQKVGPYWFDIDEIYAWMLKCTDIDNTTFEQLGESGEPFRIDAILGITLIDYIEEAKERLPELSRRLQDQLLDSRKNAEQTGNYRRLTGRQILRLIYVYYKSSLSSHVDSYVLLDSVHMTNGKEYEFQHKWDDNLRELGFTPDDISLNTLWARGMRKTDVMTDEMKKYDDADSDASIRTYPKLRKIFERKLERKKKRENLEASQRSLAGQGQSGKASGRGAGALETEVPPPPEAYDEESYAAAGKFGKRHQNAPSGEKHKDQPCFRFIRGMCPHTGPECNYSHDAKLCDPVRKKVLDEYNPHRVSCICVQKRLRPKKPVTTSPKGGGKGKRLKMCVPFLKGQCTRGAKCHNSHDERYKASALKRLEQRSVKGKGKGRGRGRGGKRFKGRSAGAVEGEAEGEEEEVELEYIEVDMDLPAEPEEGDPK